MSEAPRPALATLECLPVEIIQEIFLHALEVNFPRASIHIARALSHPLMYSWIIRVAFSSLEDPSRNGFFTRDFLPEPLDPFAISPEERRGLQTAVLGCRWCTLPLMRRCQREYLEHVVRRKCGDLVISPSDYQSLLSIGSQLSGLDGLIPNEPFNPDLCVQAKVRGSNRDSPLMVIFYFGMFVIRYDLFQLPWGRQDMPALVPDKLLCPPWTKSKLEFLQILTRFACIDENADGTRSRRVLRQVIRDRDFATFKRFMYMVVRVPWSKDLNFWPVHANHFHAALKYAEKPDDPFVSMLVKERWDNVPKDDHKLQDALLTNLWANGTT
ncbi:hypothetical protein BO70DRAFT_389371 [Aspergillus heteromorphus CBS 117.55]|uniref:Uncharacterized protein n=1 Tax=Aspergillus heteromorphus CBS 117.55 TaxID=1448321 RepID=A0A317VEB5_9EURO|nr:uncharacterized protein BO70DRAFT_389371 [Aspergillus heteromorphus CBS 117.55]PWY72305.1 hypothetical protein BO70DRAFT_389371 [Aspergillus heteromorphus CBS 117.55]